MQSTNLSDRILRPPQPWFIDASLLVALILSYIPVSRLAGWPDWMALTLCFWSIRQPQLVGLDKAFLLGLLVDIGHGAAMGQYALAYVLLSHMAHTFARRILWFPPRQQALHILPMLFIAQVVMTVVRLIAGDSFPGWTYFLAPITGALLWPALSLLLLWPQYQPEDRDDHRPI